VPAEGHPLLRGLHDVLLVEQVDRIPEGCLGDLHHDFGGQEALDCWALAVCVDEVAAAAPVEVELVGAEKRWQSPRSVSRSSGGRVRFKTKKPSVRNWRACLEVMCSAERAMFALR
jgi:hypothetical protein